MQDQDRSVLLDAPISPFSFFNDALDEVVERFQEVRRQAVVFQALFSLPFPGPRNCQVGAAPVVQLLI